MREVRWNLSFLIKQVVLISDFTVFKICIILSFVYKILAQSKKACQVDAITSILRKIQNLIKLKPPRVWPNKKTKLHRFYLQL